MRIAPDEDDLEAFELLRGAPLDARAVGRPGRGDPRRPRARASPPTPGGPVYDEARAAFRDAWGVEPVDIGVGGSIPFVAAFAERFPDAAILVTGVEDPDARAHGANESLHLGEFEKVCLAEALLLARLGALPR